MEVPQDHGDPPDQFQFGQQTGDGNPLKKPTGFMSNAPELLKHLDRRCCGKGRICWRPQGGKHADCLGKKAQRAAISGRSYVSPFSAGSRHSLWQIDESGQERLAS